MGKTTVEDAGIATARSLSEAEEHPSTVSTSCFPLFPAAFAGLHPPTTSAYASTNGCYHFSDEETQGQD